MHTYMKLNRNNELVVLRASGFSIWFLIFPAIFNTLIISCLYVFVFNPIFAYILNLKIMKVIFLRAVMDYFQFLKLPWLVRKTENDYVINAAHYSFEQIS